MKKKFLVALILAAGAALSGSASAENPNAATRGDYDRGVHPIRHMRNMHPIHRMKRSHPIHHMKRMHPIRRLEGR